MNNIKMTGASETERTRGANVAVTRGGGGGGGGGETSAGGSSERSFMRNAVSVRFLLLSATIFALGASLIRSVQSTRSMSKFYKVLSGVTENYVGTTLSSFNLSTTSSHQGLLNETKELTGMNMTSAAMRTNTISTFATTPKIAAEIKKDAEHVQRADIDGIFQLKQKHNNKDMNIVLLYADDWTWRTIGAINKVVKTPNLDDMAKRGMLFTHNCVTTSICWQSRASLVTGQYVSVHKSLLIASTSLFNETVQWSDTLYPQLRKHGYNVGYVGKWHGSMTDPFREEAFDFWRSYYGQHWMLSGGRRRHVTELNGEDALEYLRNRPKDKKFALAVSFFAIHSWDGKNYPDQFQPQNHTAHMYDGISIPVPKTATEKHFNNLPWFVGNNQSEARNRWRERYNTPTRYQETMKRIYRMAKEVDDVVGDIIQELKDQGVYDNTLLVFTTDNGIFHGEHQLAGKWYPHEESVRVPLIIQDPRMPESVRGTTNDDLTLNIDLAPTILSAAGIPVPPPVQGRDIAELYLNPEEDGSKSSPWRKDFFYEWNTGSPVDAEGHTFGDWIPPVFALIRKDYKYFYWPSQKYEQVFHIEEDPYEERDIFDSTLKSDPAMLAELRGRYAYLKNHSQSGFSV